MNELDGRAAIVTGAGSGIGRAIAWSFAEQGCSVGVLDKLGDRAAKVADEIGSRGGRAVAVTADVTSAADVEAAVHGVADGFGRLDILVNNAGVGWLGTVQDLTEDEWDQVMAINVRSIFLCSRAAIPHMVKGGGGRIINVASVTGLVASPGRAVYCASKGAVVMLTRAMALDHAQQGINVNAICPGVVITSMTEESLRDPATRQEKLDKTPLGRLAQPEEIAPAALYLAGPGSSFVTGACLVVDGGWSID
jgi:meso-butanediol dehydrogenase / (S,S)-butanediol dehydrogenase / diacetyl reductase